MLPPVQADLDDRTPRFQLGIDRDFAASIGVLLKLRRKVDGGK
jgi:hypothetical protein